MNRAIGLHVRLASVADAAAACECVRRSITELCTADHRDDAATLDAWLRNKTPENFARWIRAAPELCWIAQVEGEVERIAGYAQCELRPDRYGHVLLLYVDPQRRGCGVSSALLAAMEAAACDRGAIALTLQSTQTALPFYLARGFALAGPARPGFGISTGQPLLKALGTVVAVDSVTPPA